MKILKNNWTKKLIVALVIIILFNVVLPTRVMAADLGGILLKPIFSFFAAIIGTVDATLGFIFLAGETVDLENFLSEFRSGP